MTSMRGDAAAQRLRPFMRYVSVAEPLCTVSPLTPRRVQASRHTDYQRRRGLPERVPARLAPRPVHPPDEPKRGLVVPCTQPPKRRTSLRCGVRTAIDGSSVLARTLQPLSSISSDDASVRAAGARCFSGMTPAVHGVERRRIISNVLRNALSQCASSATD